MTKGCGESRLDVLLKERLQLNYKLLDMMKEFLGDVLCTVL